MYSKKKNGSHLKKEVSITIRNSLNGKKKIILKRLYYSYNSSIIYNSTIYSAQYVNELKRSNPIVGAYIICSADDVKNSFF